MSVFIKETGSDKWVFIRDGEVRFTSNKDQDTKLESADKLYTFCTLYSELITLYNKGTLQTHNIN